MSIVGFKARNHPQQVEKRGASDTVDERITPDSLFDPLHSVFQFTLDAAANATNRRVPRFYSLENSGLDASWEREHVWCNPPYSAIRPWVEKAWAEHKAGCPLIVMLIPANRSEQPWWQELIEPYRDGRGPIETRFVPRRLNFGVPGNEGGKFKSSAPFGCVLVIWRAA